MSDSKVAIVPEEVFNSMVEFIISKPYSEVSALLDTVKSSVQMADIPKETPEEKTVNGGTI